MATRDTYADGVPNWVDLATPDPAAARSFYADLFGWSYRDIEMGDGNTYAIAQIDGLDVAAIAPQPPDQGGPPRWQMYVATSDVDAATERVEPAGGSVLAGPF